MENEKLKNEILCQQLQLLAERSAKLSIDDLVKISIAMAKISAEIKQPMKTVNITNEYPKQPELVASEINAVKTIAVIKIGRPIKKSEPIPPTTYIAAKSQEL